MVYIRYSVLWVLWRALVGKNAIICNDSAPHVTKCSLCWCVRALPIGRNIPRAYNPSEKMMIKYIVVYYRIYYNLVYEKKVNTRISLNKTDKLNLKINELPNFKPNIELLLQLNKITKFMLQLYYEISSEYCMMR